LSGPRAPRFTLTLGSLVGLGLRTYFGCFVPFVLLTTLVLSPWIAVRTALFEDWFEIPVQGFVFVDLAVHWGLAYVATGALTFGVVRRLQGERTSLLQVTVQGVRTFLRVLGTSVSCTLVILLYTVLLVVPGIVAAVRLFVAVPVAALERRVGAAAMVRSAELTIGSRPAIFGAWLLVKVVQVGYPLLLQFVWFSLLRRGAYDFVTHVRLYYWTDIALTILVDAFAATMAAVCYFQLRQGKENVGVEQIAAVFD
jgi:hypothetical protein